MKKVIIHAGLPKTGTSSLQSFLAKNRENLKSLGFEYPVNKYNMSEVSRQAKGLLGSGNLRPLFSFITRGTPHFLEPLTKKPTKIEIDNFLRSFFSAKADCLLYSNENFSRLPHESLQNIKNFLEDMGYEIKVIIFTRNDETLEKSVYLQNVKSLGEYEPFQYSNGVRNTYNLLRAKLLEIFDVHCIEYKKSQTNTIHEFLDYLGILNEDVFNESLSENYNINPVITAEELLVLRRLNYFHKNGKLSLILSSLLLEDEETTGDGTAINDNVLNISGELSTRQALAELNDGSVDALVDVWDRAGKVLSNKLKESMYFLYAEKEYSRTISELLSILMLANKNKNLARERLMNFKFKTFEHDNNKNMMIGKLINRIKNIVGN